jgi:VWFA-related protein
MRGLRQIALTVAIWFSANAQAPAPVQDAQGPVLSLNTRLVQLSVLVHDKKGLPVRDLTRDDFAIFDNGKPQQVALFSLVPEPSPIAGAAPSSGQLASGQLALSNRTLRRADGPTAATIILLDTLNMRTTDELQYVKRELPKFLKNLNPGDPIALYSLAGPNVRVIHDFTDDTESLIRAAQHTTKNPVFTAAPGGPDIGGGYFQALDDWLQSGRLQDQRSLDRWRTEWTLSALESIAQHASGIPGRKNLVWISSAFPLVIGLDPDTMAQESKSRIVDTDLESYRARLKRLAELYNNADLAVYPVDPRGLMIDDRYGVSARIPGGMQQPRMKTVGEITAPEIATMVQLASDTGGRAFYNANDLEGSLRRALDDAHGAYVIGFYPPESAWDGRYHKVDIKVARTDIDVRSRRGYYAITKRAETEPERNGALKLAAASPLEGASIGVTVNVTSNPLAFGSQHLEVVVDPHTVRFENQNGKWHTALDIVFVQQAPDGSITAGESIQYGLNFKTYEQAQAQGLLIRRDVVIKQGGARMRVVVRESTTDAVGSVSVPIEQNQRSK